MREDGPPPVIVLGGGLTALGVIRIFGRARIPAYLVAPPRDLASRSRWSRRIEPSLAETADPGELAAFLARLPFPAAVPMACTDTWLSALAALEPSLAQRFPAPVSPLDTLRPFLDKGLFASLLRELAVPHPETHLVGGPTDLAPLDGPGERTFFLKPRNSQRFHQHFGVKAFTVRTPAEARARLSELEATGFEAVLQEYVPGPPSAHYFVDGFVDRAGRFLTRFARRRLRMYPPDFGNSSAVVSVPLAEVSAAVSSLERLLGHVAFRGIFSAEFKLDSRDGTLRILEVNTRPWWHVEFAALCGVDVCTLAYRDALGIPQLPIRPYAIGRRHTVAALDARALWCGFRRRQLGGRELARESLASLGTLRTWDDPAPALARAGELVRRATRLERRGRP